MYKLSEYLSTMQQGLEILLKDHNIGIHIANNKIEVGEPPYILLDSTAFGLGRTLPYYSVQLSVILNAAGLDDDVPAQIYGVFRFLTRFVLPNFVSGMIGEYNRERGGRIYNYTWAIELEWDLTLVGEDPEAQNTFIQRLIIGPEVDDANISDIIIESNRNG